MWRGHAIVSGAFARGPHSSVAAARNIGPARSLHSDAGRHGTPKRTQSSPGICSGPPTGGLSIGIVLQGTYRIVRPLAEGGCGEVYLAAHTRLPGRFAVKLLHRSLVRDSDAFSRFRQEAEITSSLRHPHIVQVFDFNVTDSGVPYLVMELLEGKLLSQRIAAVGAARPDRGGRHHRPDRERAARRARARHRAPRSQARERDAAGGRRRRRTSSRCWTSASRRRAGARG